MPATDTAGSHAHGLCRKIGNRSREIGAAKSRPWGAPTVAACVGAGHARETH